MTLAAVFASVSARAEIKGALRSAVYQDSDRTFIQTTAVSASSTIGDHVLVGGHYLVDVVSSASVDVVTGATGRIDELRHEGAGSLTYRDSERSLSGSYLYSVEHDWSSHSGAFSLSHDFAQHNLTLGLGAIIGINTIGSVDNDDVHERLVTGSGQLSAIFTASPNDILGLMYWFSYLDGYQASPYRFVVYGDLRAVRENVPTQRTRQALTARWNHHFVDDLALQTHLRGYVDDWGILSFTAGTELVIGLGSIDLGLHLRGYAQRRAEFYRGAYAVLDRYRTADRELATLSDLFAGCRATYRSGDLQIEAKLDGFVFWFTDVASLPLRYGALLEIGIEFAQ